MTVDAIKSVAVTTKNAVSETGSKVVHALTKFSRVLGKNLHGIAKKVAEWAVHAFKALPIYMQIAKDYAKLGFSFIKENKTSVSIGTGIGLGFAGIIAILAKVIHRSENSANIVSA